MSPDIWYAFIEPRYMVRQRGSLDSLGSALGARCYQARDGVTLLSASLLIKERGRARPASKTMARHGRDAAIDGRNTAVWLLYRGCRGRKQTKKFQSTRSRSSETPRNALLDTHTSLKDSTIAGNSLAVGGSGVKGGSGVLGEWCAHTVAHRETIQRSESSDISGAYILGSREWLRGVASLRAQEMKKNTSKIRAHMDVLKRCSQVAYSRPARGRARVRARSQGVG